MYFFQYKMELETRPRLKDLDYYCVGCFYFGYEVKIQEFG